MRNVKVLFHGSCWPTNIGNAFVNLGAIHTLKTALGKEGSVFHVGGMSGYLFSTKGKSANTLPIGEIIDCDYVVNAGMTLCYDHLIAALSAYQQFTKRGTKIIFLGGGAGQYTDKEVKKVREIMKKFPLYVLISRDRYTFEKYGELAQHSYDGIDCGFFINDCTKPIPLNITDFDVMNFDNLDEPRINHEGRQVIRTHHSCCPSFLKKEYFKYPNTLISDLPSDYLTLYAQAKVTYSDRVHACIPALAFGNLAKMYFKSEDKRLHMFERIGASDVDKMPVRLDLERINIEKKNQILFLQTLFNEK